MPLQLRLLVALLALVSLLAARHLHRRQQAASTGAAHTRLLVPLGALPSSSHVRGSRPL
jgi:hypothetical protein